MIEQFAVLNVELVCAGYLVTDRSDEYWEYHNPDARLAYVQVHLRDDDNLGVLAGRDGETWDSVWFVGPKTKRVRRRIREFLR